MGAGIGFIGGSLGLREFVGRGDVVMDGVLDKPREFRTPARILIPKLVRSRDGWKAKAQDRKRRLRKSQVRIRDVEASRQGWRQRAEAAERKVAELEQAAAAQRAELAAVHSEATQLREALKKK